MESAAECRFMASARPNVVRCQVCPPFGVLVNAVVCPEQDSEGIVLVDEDGVVVGRVRKPDRGRLNQGRSLGRRAACGEHEHARRAKMKRSRVG